MPNLLLAVFGMDDATTRAIARGLLAHLAVSGLFVTVALTYTGALQGTGDTRSPFYISIVSQIVIPLGLCVLFQRIGVFEPADIWRAIVAGHVARCVLSWYRFRQGRWERIVVDIGRPQSRSIRSEVSR
jgi:Na+-driven multidrug efflux pump